MRKNYVIVDIDGTVADCTHRLHYIEPPKKDWETFHKECTKDEPIHRMINLVKVLEPIATIVFCTGRMDSSHKETKQWIRDNMNIMEPTIIMRPTGDYRPDIVVKPEQLAAAFKGEDKIGPNNVWFILEDRAKVVKKWRELGFTCLQCADGEY